MSLTELLRTIEKTEFAAHFSIINNFRILLWVLEENETLQLLIEHLKQNTADKSMLMSRLDVLANDAQPDIQHPHDITLLAYLFVLSRVDLTLAFGKSKMLLRLPNLWWSNYLAKSIIQIAETASKTVTLDLKGAPARVQNLTTPSVENAEIKYVYNRHNTRVRLTSLTKEIKTRAS